MKRLLACALLLACASSAAWAATRIPMVNNNIAVDGIVSAGTGGVPPPGCPAGGPDAAWGGVLGQEFKLAPGGVPTSQKVNLFVAGREAAGKVQKLNIGVHVEGAPDFSTNDKLTLFFQADGNRSDWDAANDFALVFDGVGSAAATPLNQDGCANPAGPALFYKRNAGNTAWEPQATFPAGITFKAAFDYETAHDAELNIWELEIEIDLSVLNPGLTLVRDSQIGLGGKLYLFEAGVAATTAYYFPQTVAPSDQFFNPNPNQGGVTPATLEKATVGACSFDVIITSHQGSDAQGNPGQFTQLNPNSPTDFDQATGAARLGRQIASPPRSSSSTPPILRTPAWSRWRIPARLQ